MTCTDAHRVMSRDAGEDSSLPAAERRTFEAHLAECAACRGELEAQREVAGLLRQRLQTPVRPGLAARVAARIDREGHDEDWLALANWRAWTVGLAPVAGALLVAAYLDTARAIGSAGLEPAPDTILEWTVSASAPAAADVFLQPSTTGDALIEAVLTGSAPTSGEPDGR
jgi:anti-sigma factor RsiW